MTVEKEKETAHREKKTMGKTVRQLADELGVSKTAVMKKIDNLGLRSELRTKGNKIVLSFRQAQLIKSSFAGYELESLKGQIDTLNGQLKESRDDLQDTRDELAAALQREKVMKQKQERAASPFGKKIIRLSELRGFILDKAVIYEQSTEEYEEFHNLFTGDLRDAPPELADRCVIAISARRKGVVDIWIENREGR